MSSATGQAAAIPLEDASVSSNLARTVFTVAWMSVALGVGLELILVLIAAGAGTFVRIHPFLADAVQKVGWGAFVCVGLAFGKVASKLRPHATGLLGLLSAPLGFAAARTMHKTAEKSLGLVSAAAVGPSPLTLATLKGLEYAALGLLLGLLMKRQVRSPLAYIAAGFGASVLFGGTIIAAMDYYNPAPLSGVPLATRVVNEMLFPVGCSLVLYAAEALTSRVKAA
jgi:hypothetical protein